MEPPETSCSTFEYLHKSTSKSDRSIQKCLGAEITKGRWKNYVNHVIKQEKKFREMDQIIDNEIESLVIPFSDNNDSDVIEEELL